MTKACGRLPLKLIALFIAFSFIVILPTGSSDADSSTISTIYDSLTEKQKAGYNAIDTAVKNNTNSGDLSYLSGDEGDVVRYAYAGDHPEIFWFYDNFKLYTNPLTGNCVDLEYEPKYTPGQIDTMKKQIQDSLSTLKVNAEDPEYKRLLTIHDWLCDRITYTDGAEHEGDIYGAIVEGKCVCQGYTMAFTYLCHQNGFKCVYVWGYTYTSSTVTHAWNLVFGEGNWYFVDVTWDDDESGSPERTYFMVGSQTKINGRVFATEDHMANSLYGITPSETKYELPTEFSTLTWIILGVIVVVGVVFILVKVHTSKKNKQNLASGCVLSDNEGNGNNCPACGAKLDNSCDFCPQCGTIVKKEPETDNSQEKN